MGIGSSQKKLEWQNGFFKSLVLLLIREMQKVKSQNNKLFYQADCQMLKSL